MRRGTVASALLATTLTIQQMPLAIYAKDDSGLSTAYTGDEILQYAKDTYDDWSYQDVDTCTGFVSHVLYEDLKVPVGMEIAGPRVFVGYGWEPYNGYLTDYNPDEMIDVAERLVQEGKVTKVFEGNSYDTYNSKIPLRNGDIVLTSRVDMNAQYGHVALIEVRDDAIGWFGAHGPAETVDQEVSFMAFPKSPEHTTYKSDSPKDSTRVYNGWLRVYRYVDYESPEIKSDIETSKEITYSLAVKETNKTTSDPVEGTEFTFNNADGEEIIKTDKQGVARKSIVNRYDLNVNDYKYVTNYDKIAPEEQKKVDEQGIYHSFEEAQNSADDALMKLALEKPVDFTGYQVVQKSTGKTVTTANPKAETESTTIELTVEDAKMTKRSVKIVGFGIGAKCAIYDSNEKLVEEFLMQDLGQGTVGYIAKNLTENETYKVREIQEPRGYVRSKDVTFTVGTSNNTAFLQEAPIMATLKVTATGDVFDKFEDGVPKYKTETIDDVYYTLVAKEDIKTGTKIVYTHGQEIGTFKNEIGNLPVGHYYFTVAETPDGYATDHARYDFTVENGATADPVYEMEVTLQQQKVKLSVKDFADIKEVSVYQKDTNKMLYSSKVNQDGIVVASETNSLPIGKYYLTVDGDKKTYDFEIKPTASTTSEYTKKIYKHKATDDMGEITIRLSDAKDANKPLRGVKYILSDSENFETILQEAETDSMGMARFKPVKYGTYFVKQDNKTGNYSLDDKTYMITVDTETSGITVNTTNRTTEAIIESLDLGGVVTVDGVKYKLQDKTGAVIDTWEATKMAHLIDGLTEGETYTIIATDTVDGYDKPADVDFVMRDGITVAMKAKEVMGLLELTSTMIPTWQLLIATFTSLPIVVSTRQFFNNIIRKRKRKNG